MIAFTFNRPASASAITCCHVIRSRRGAFGDSEVWRDVTTLNPPVRPDPSGFVLEKSGICGILSNVGPVRERQVLHVDYAPVLGMNLNGVRAKHLQGAFDRLCLSRNIRATDDGELVAADTVQLQTLALERRYNRLQQCIAVLVPESVVYRLQTIGVYDRNDGFAAMLLACRAFGLTVRTVVADPELVIRPRLLVGTFGGVVNCLEMRLLLLWRHCRPFLRRGAAWHASGSFAAFADTLLRYRRYDVLATFARWRFGFGGNRRGCGRFRWWLRWWRVPRLQRPECRRPLVTDGGGLRRRWPSGCDGDIGFDGWREL